MSTSEGKLELPPLSGGLHDVAPPNSGPVRRPGPTELAAAEPAPLVAMHWVFLVVCSIVVLLSFLLNVPGEEQVFLPGLPVPLPGMCVSHEYLGFDCPGCGLTRSFISIAHGQWARAWHFNPAGVLMFILVAAQIPYRTIQIWRIRRRLSTPWPRGLNWYLWLVLTGLLTQWLVKTGLRLFG